MWRECYHGNRRRHACHGWGDAPTASQIVHKEDQVTVTGMEKYALVI